MHKASDGHWSNASRHFSDIRCFWCYGIEIHISAKFACIRVAINTYVDNHSAFFYHILFHEFRFTKCRYEDICLRTYFCKIFCAAMAYGNGCIFIGK